MGGQYFADVFSLGGNARLLANGDIESDGCGPASNSVMYEVTKTLAPKMVWQIHITGQNAYRGLRGSSLYTGVQW